MIKIVNRFNTLFALCLFTSLFCVTNIFAAVGVGVKPLRTELMIDPGASATAKIKVINNESQQLTVKPSIEAYVENDESGFPVSADLEDSDERNIKSWISFTEDELVIAPNSERETTVTVKVPADATPGGRYASIVYEPVIEGESGGVSVRARVASLLLVTVSGEEIIDGNVTNFSLQDNKILADKPVTFSINFKNNGNVHIKPEGNISIMGEDGKKLQRIARFIDPITGREIEADEVPINLSGGNVLPKSARLFLTEWNQKVKPGKYTAKMEFSYGSEVVNKEISFDIKEQFELSDFSVDVNENSTSFSISVKNAGNIYEKLAGSIDVINDYNTLIASFDISDEEDIYINPGEENSIQIPWLNKKLTPGKYSATLKIKHGVEGNEISKAISFSQLEEFNVLKFIKSPAGFITTVILVLAVTVIALLFKKPSKKKVVVAIKKPRVKKAVRKKK